MLETARRGAPSRHRTLGDALDWSYQLLSPSEKQVFQELAIFAGEFDLHASWNAAELLRVQAVIRYSHQTDSPQSLNNALQSAMNLAQEQSATSWVRKIEETMKGCLLG